MDCPKCNKRFDGRHRKPIVGVCGHTLCEPCTISRFGKKSGSAYCYLCVQIRCTQSWYSATDQTFKRAAQNHHVMKLVQQFTSKSKIFEFVNLHGSGILSLLKCHCCGTIVEEDKVRFCKTCSDENGSSVFDETGSGTVDKGKLKETALCASCFLDGPHKGHESVLWSYIKLRSKVGEAVSNLRDAKNRTKYRLEEEFQNLMNSLDSVDQSLIILEENGKSPHTDAAHFKEIIETCKKEIEVCRGLETHLSTEFSEQVAKVEETNEKLTCLSSVSKD